MRINLPGRVLDAISEYLPIVENIPEKNQKFLIESILKMEAYGVEGYGERIIYPDGYSSLFSTSLKWHDIYQDEEFKKDNISHSSLEMIKMKKMGGGMISRSKDKIDTPFLEKLEKAGVNNSIIRTEFYSNRIEIIYFMANANNPDARDNIINNLESLYLIRNFAKPALQYITQSKLFKSNKEILLNSNALDSLKNSRIYKNKKHNIILSGKEIMLTQRELECLVFLRFGSSNQFIADQLKISVETVKGNISALKLKLLVSEKKHLINIAQCESINNLSKIIGGI